MKHALILSIGLILLTAPIGCSNTAAEGEEDHHLEHYVPPHKPANFAELVDEIADRAQHLSDHAGHGHSDEGEEFQELIDIVNWIPELAADSDLNEEEWNQARAAGEKMAASLADRISENGDRNLEGLPKLLADDNEILRKLVPAAGKPEPAIHHDHDHGDGHEHHDHGDHEDGDHDHGDQEDGEHEDDDHDHSDREDDSTESDQNE